MSLTREEVEHIALLARLSLTEEEKERYRGQLSSILEHVAQLQALDTKDVPPLSSVIAEKMILREDVPGESLSPESLMKNAPDSSENQYKVPLILEGENPEDDSDGKSADA